MADVVLLLFLLAASLAPRVDVVVAAGGSLWPAMGTPVDEESSDVTWRKMGSKRLDMFPGGDKCGSWHRNYTQLHKLIRRGSERWYAEKKSRGEDAAAETENPVWRRFATFSCGRGSLHKCGGLGDILLGIVSTFVIALLQNRALVIDHLLLPHAFEPNLIDWRISDDVPMAPSLSFSQEHTPAQMTEQQQDDIKGAVVEVDLLNVVPEEMESFFNPLEDAGNIRIKWNRGILTKLLLFDLDKIGGPTPGADRWTQVLHEIGIRLPTAFGCFLKYIMKPRLQIYKMVTEELGRLDAEGVGPSSSICIHVRTPDEQTWDSQEGEPLESAASDLLQWADDKVLSCAKKIEDFWFHSPPQVVKWVFLSSSQALKEAVKAQRGGKVFITETTPTHTALRKDVPGQVLSFKAAAAEWLLYTRCSLYLMTESGFSKTAALYAGHPFSIFLLARKHYKSQKNEWQDVCQPLSPASYTLLGARWTGI